jgi:thiamine-monophosphate kinase
MKAEDRFVERLKEMLPDSGRVAVGPGDDAAVVRVEGGDLVATTDLLVEGVDFLPGADPEAVGRRALAVNLSDLAAMGAAPEFFLLSIAFPARLGDDFPLAVTRGALSRARAFGASLVGGDLSAAAATVLSVALWGRAPGRPILRSGGGSGDLLFVSGYPGRAAGGLELARRRKAGAEVSRLSPGHAELLEAYRDPEPRVALGLELSRRGLAHAAIDLSDGLGVDAGRLARASGLRAIIERERLPVSAALAALAGEVGRNPLDWILGGGDDYELLFAAPEAALSSVLALGTPEVPVKHVGRLEEGEGAVLREGKADRDIASLGHDHFEKRT